MEVCRIVQTGEKEYQYKGVKYIGLDLVLKVVFDKEGIRVWKIITHSPLEMTPIVVDEMLRYVIEPVRGSA